MFLWGAYSALPAEYLESVSSTEVAENLSGRKSCRLQLGLALLTEGILMFYWFFDLFFSAPASMCTPSLYRHKEQANPIPLQTPMCIRIWHWYIPLVQQISKHFIVLFNKKQNNKITVREIKTIFLYTLPEVGGRRERGGQGVEGENRKSIYKEAKAASDATGCRLLFFSHRH